MVSKLLASNSDYIIWYAKNKAETKFHNLFLEKKPGTVGGEIYQWLEFEDCKIINIKKNQNVDDLNTEKIFAYTSITI